MASERHSDENLNPEANDDTPSVVEKRRKSGLERKYNQRFQNSGMKKGALVRYLIAKKQQQNEDEQSTNSNGATGSALQEENNNEQHNNDDSGVEEGALLNLSQSSSVIFEGEFNPNENREEVPIVEIDDEDEGSSAEDSHRDSDRDDNGHEERERSRNRRDDQIPPASEEDSLPPPGDDIQSPSDPSSDNPPTSSDGDNEFQQGNDTDPDEESPVHLPLPDCEDEPMSVGDKIKLWQKNKRTSTEEPQGSTGNRSVPSPNKKSRLSPPEAQGRAGIFSRREDTPARSSSVSSCSGAPIKITSVFSVAASGAQTSDNSNSTAVSSSNQQQPSTSTSSNEERERRAILRLKEVDNPKVGEFIKKRNWIKALQLKSKDLKNGNLPVSTYVSKLIRSAIVGDGTRVAKQVPGECIQFLESLVNDYPPLHGNRSDTSVEYYRSIFRNVFEEIPYGNVSKLYDFYIELCKRVEMTLESQVETVTLRLLILVTNLVSDQFQKHREYKNKKGVTVNPPLLQNFLEDTEGMYNYDPCCRNIVNCFFTTEAPEMRCIYMKWIDLIAMSFGSYVIFRRKEIEKFVTDVAQHCQSREDLGLFVYLNLEDHSFSKQVCERIFEKLTLVPANARQQPSDIIERRNSYLKCLADTLVIKPAESVISDLCLETCPTNENLRYKRTHMERYLEDPQTQDTKRKNVKGETRLHTLCNSTIENLLEEVRKCVRQNPENISAQDNYGNTPLHDCAANDKGNIIRELMDLNGKRKIPVKIDFLIRNKNLETPLHLAASYSSAQTVDILKYFATDCKMLQDVLLAPDKDGKLPFEVAANQIIKNKLRPKHYDVEAMFFHNGIRLHPDSQKEVMDSFSLRKVIAWWKKSQS